MDAQHQQVGNALVALVLEMVLRHPKRVVPVFVHAAGHGLDLRKHCDEVLVGIPPLIHRRRVLAHVVEIDVSGVQR